ncbi:GDSL-type esterase/lipase family protein [Streptomyces sp. BBFR2]|uniref:GDSL-type esterase/lipase family protein n=1 Tax=Streptomyces sp. BBFR2 TaxID=3372854 RepID=UPI0037DA3C2B
MPVGDSMTIGSSGDFTWRYRLWQHLRATYDGPFRLVGPRDALHDAATGAATSQRYGDPAFPADARRHLAGWGEGWLHMAPLIGDAVRAHRPDTLLVSLGLIDLGFYTDPEQTAANVRAFLTAARRADPHLRAVLLPVLDNSRAVDDPEFAAGCARFNALLAETAAALTTPASPFVLAPAPAWDLARHTYDGTHPSPAGEHALAAAFAGTLYTAWGVGGPYTRAATAPEQAISADPAAPAPVPEYAAG